MSKVIAQSIFNETVAERNWRTYVTSALVHAVIIAAAFLITFPAVEVLREPIEEHATLLAPIIPKNHPAVEAPRIKYKPIVPPLQPVVAKNIAPPVVPKPEPKPPEPKPLPVLQPEQPKIVADIKPALPQPPAPKPEPKTGAFQDFQIAKAEPVRKQVVVGGFGDPHGVNPADHPTTSPILMARVGGFDSPQGEGNAGGGGHFDAGGVRNSGFASASPSTIASGHKANLIRTGSFGDDSTVSGNSSTAGTVRSSGFGDAVASAPQHRQMQASTVATTTPVEILYKPRPLYTAEAREMHLEGHVSLQVVFQASGSVRIVRVIKGLGHGLDEAAEQAAQQVRFKPATRSGSPVDTDATISITFELT